MGRVIYLSMQCQAEGCSKDAATRGYCRAHYQRMRKAGELRMRTETLKEKGRLIDHPLYFRWTRAKVQKKLCPEWLDFWTFVEGVGDSGGCTRVYQIDKTRPLGPGNFRWAEKQVGEVKNAYYRAWYKNGRKGRDARYRKAYGIGVDEYEAMLAAQGGVCAICHQEEKAIVRSGVNDDIRHLAVDHDHGTDVVRGLLCADCNRAIGLLREEAAIAFSAFQYLTKHKSLGKVS